MQYDVGVAIYNENYSNKTNAFKEWSPPSVPDISDSAIQITNDTNQNVFITISKLMDEDKNLQSENRYYILTSSSRDEENDGVDLKNFEMALKNDSELILKNINKFHNGSQEDITDTKTISINSTEHGKIYRLYLYFVNKCHGKIELKMLKRNPFSLEPANSNKALYALILLIFLIPLALYVYM